MRRYAIPLLAFGIGASAQDQNTASATIFNPPAQWAPDMNPQNGSVSVVNADACKTTYHLIPNNSTLTFTIVQNSASVQTTISSSDYLQKETLIDNCALKGTTSAICTNRFYLTLGHRTASPNINTMDWDDDLVKYLTLPITAGGDKIAAVTGSCSTGYDLGDVSIPSETGTTGNSASTSNSAGTAAMASSSSSAQAATTSNKGGAAPRNIATDLYKIVIVPAGALAAAALM